MSHGLEFGMAGYLLGPVFIGSTAQNIEIEMKPPTAVTFFAFLLAL